MATAHRAYRGRLLTLAVLSLLSATMVACHAHSEDAPATAATETKTPPAAADANPADAEAAPAVADAAPENPFPNRPSAPDLDGGKSWLNTAGPISLRDLKGKIVLIDFWTYCCINCMHVLPDLDYLEKKFGKQIVVIGCHSAKFDNEKDTENIRRAIMRYEIKHPVINDAEMKVWRKFGIQAWPTLIMIDPEGKYLGEASGEGNRELLEGIIERLIAYHRAKGTLDETPVKFALENEKVQPTPLRFPGKILADEAGDRLFISDSNHNRIVITTLAGKLVEVVGNGRFGSANGAYDKAEFNRPQGMALVGQTLYVADTENHMLRAVNLTDKTVSTIAGLGSQAEARGPGGLAKETALNSPWDLCYVAGKLYVAMAGPHQIWVYESMVDTIRPYAGSGREDVRNGSLSNCALAQPSGLVSDGKFLYAVDSEGSSIRQIPLDPDGEVTTVAGPSDLPRGQSLFAFADIDDSGEAARFQHPLGIAMWNNRLLLADTYNHKVKTVGLSSGEAKTLLGDGVRGDRSSPPRFSEPSGLAVAGNRLYIADTNNHQIRIVDLKVEAGKVVAGEVSALAIEGLAPPAPPADTPSEESQKVTTVPEQKIAAAEALQFEVTLPLPEGYKLSPDAPPVWKVEAEEGQTLFAADQLGKRDEGAAEGNVAKFKIPLTSQAGQTKITVSVTYNYCRAGKGGLCKIQTLAWSLPVVVGPEGAAAVKLGQ